MKIKATYVRLASLAIAVVLALPFIPGMFNGFYLWTSPYLLLLTAVNGRVLVPLQFIALAVIILALFRHRWYCKWVCPTGALCDLASQRKSKSNLHRVPKLGGYIALTGFVAALIGVPVLAMVDPINILHTFVDAFNHPLKVMLIKMTGLVILLGISLWIPHVWCLRLCPLGGLQDLLTRIKRLLLRHKTGNSTLQTDRRLALGALTGLGAGLLLRNLVKPAQADVIRPPGSLPEDELAVTCLRCGNCSRACPTDIISPSTDAGRIESLLTPRVSFQSAYCLPECTACGTVCPSGTIHKLTHETKKQWTMGLARINIDDCLLMKLKECSLCRQFCAYDAIIIRRSDTDLSAWPEIDPRRCVGCGACIIACPVRVIDIETVPGRRLDG